MDAGLERDLSQVVLPGLPAPGGGFTFRPSGAEYSRITLVSFQLATSAVVANRNVSLALTDGSGVTLATIPSPATQTLSQTDTYVFGIGLYPYSVNASSAVVAPLPNMWLRAGQSIVVTVAGVDTTDAISRIRVVLDQVTWGAAGDE